MEANIEKILKVKNWDNVLLRTSVRQDILTDFYKNSTTPQAAPVQLNERTLVEFLHKYNDNELFQLREKMFKLARDQYVEEILVHIGLKPLLREVPKTSAAVAGADNKSSYMLKCNLMKDIVELLEYIVGTRATMSQRSVYFDENSKFQFPLGQKYLMQQVNHLKQFRAKIMSYQAELQKCQKITVYIQKFKNKLLSASKKLEELSKNNEHLRLLLVALLVFSMIITVLFVFTNCFTSKYNKQQQKRECRCDT